MTGTEDRFSHQHAQQHAEPRTAADAGWHESRYNIGARIPESDNTAVVNLFKGTCCECTPIEGYLLSALDEISEDHPFLPRLAKSGLICNFDEQAVIETMGRAACTMPNKVFLTICPTMLCNFRCPYCFQDHSADAQARCGSSATNGAEQGRDGSGSAGGSDQTCSSGSTDDSNQTCGSENTSAVMSNEVQQQVVALAERMLEASHAKTLQVMWFGGEPLLAPAVIEQLSAHLMQCAHDHGASYHASITTNGYLLDQETADMLERASVESATITLDGVDSAHDVTRFLAGGGPTFERIAHNLRTVPMPFEITIRHNVHAGNVDDQAEVEAFVAGLAQESGNRISYYPACVLDNPVAAAHGIEVGQLEDEQAMQVALRQEATYFEPGKGHYCNAQLLFSITIDPQGRLYKCWEAAGKPEFSFGNVESWNPTDPLTSASETNNLTRFLNTASPLDDECKECLWLPLCVGGCPMKRFQGHNTCVPFKNNPADFALAVRASMKRGN